MSGKPGIAPCGHAGEHVVGGYVRCLTGCDGVTAAPEHVNRENTQKICRHPSRYIFGRSVWCSNCGRRLRGAP